MDGNDPSLLGGSQRRFLFVGLGKKNWGGRGQEIYAGGPTDYLQLGRQKWELGSRGKGVARLKLEEGLTPTSPVQREIGERKDTL